MKFTTHVNPRLLLLKTGWRPAGNATIDGKDISWDGVDQVIGIPLENTSGKVMKYTIEPAHAKSIYDILDDVCWGTLVELTICEKQVVDVTILCDWLNDFNEAEN